MAAVLRTIQGCTKSGLRPFTDSRCLADASSLMLQCANCIGHRCTFQVIKCRSVYTSITKYMNDLQEGHKKSHQAVSNGGNGNGSGKKYSVGVFGAGRIAGVHLKNILRNRRLDLQWIVDDSAARAASVQEEMYVGDIPFFTSKDRDQLLSDKSLDAVCVLTPTTTHTDYICTSLKKGKAVFVEKPAGETMTDIKTCYETAEQYERPLLTGFQRRFDPVLGDLFNAAHDGSLGTIQIIRSTTRDSPKPSYEFLKSADRTGCNILSDLGVHDIDMLVWLTKAERPKSIYLLTNTFDPVLQEIEEPDVMTAVIKYHSGIIATVDAVREAVYGYDVRVEVFGNEGMALAENPRTTTSVIDQRQGAKMQRLHNSFPQRFEKAFENEIDHFVSCLDGKSVPMVTKEESLLTAEIIAKGVESYKKGQAVNFN